jgi:hypothetical protein
MGKIVFPAGVILDFTPDTATVADKFLLQDSTNNSIVAYTAIPANRLVALDPLKIVVTDADGFISTAGATDISLTELNHLNTVHTNIQVQLDSKQTASNFDPDLAIVTNGDGDLITSDTTAIEIGYSSGVTSPIQPQIDSKEPIITGGATSITSVDLSPNRALISSGAGKVAVSSVTSTELSYSGGVLGPIQSQLDTKLTANIVGPQIGNLLYYTGSTWTNFANGSAGQVLGYNGSMLEWLSPSVNGIPAGGTINQFLRKDSGTDYDASWQTFVTADITDITATADEIDVLAGHTVTNTEFNHLTGVGSNIQDQLDAKLHRSLAYNSIWVGDAGNLPIQLGPGNNGTILTVVNNAPVWQTPTPPGDTSGPGLSTDNAIARWNGTTGDSLNNSIPTVSDTGDIENVTTLSTGQVSVLNQAAIRLYETGSTDYVGIRASGTSATYTITLPAAAPTAGTALVYDGANYVWDAASGGVSSFFDLTEVTETDFSGDALKYVRVNAAADGLEFATLAAGGTVTSVSGVSNRTTITGTATVNPTVDIAATYVGQASITTLGTITTGVWNGTDIPLSAGGTGATLVDPNADRIFFWDDSAGSTAFLAPGTTLAISTTTIDVADGGISDTKLRDSSGVSVIGRSANSTGDPADIVAGTDHFVLRRSGTTLGFGLLALDSISMSTNRILGRTTASTGKAEELTVQNGLTLGSGVLKFGGTFTESTNLIGAGFNLTGSGFNTLQLAANSEAVFSVSSGTGIRLRDDAVHQLFLGEVAGVTFNLGSDAANDMYYRNGSGYFSRLPIGTDGQYLSINDVTGNPMWTNDIIEDRTATTDTIDGSENGKILRYTNVAGCTITVPTGLVQGFSVVIYRADGAGLITINSAGTFEGVANTIEQEATAATIYHRGGDVHVALGSLGAATGGGGSGTVTSVGLSAPSIFSVADSPVVTSGTIALSLANQANNTVFAGPATAGSSAPTFRSLVIADMPNETVEDVAGTTYTFLESDNKKIKHFTNAAGCTVTIPTGLTTGWTSVAYRGATAGAITFGSAGTYEGESNSLENQETAATIVHRGSNVHMALGAFGTSGGGGTGTVTSVAMSVPSFLSVTGSPITTSGTLAVTLSGTALPTANGGTGLTTVGTANQVLGMNSAATGLEYKTITTGTTAVSNNVGITHTAGGLTIQVPDASLLVRGVVTNGAQTFGGVKTFFSNPIIFSAQPTMVFYAGTSGAVNYGQGLKFEPTASRLGIGSGSTTANGIDIINTNAGSAASASILLRADGAPTTTIEHTSIVSGSRLLISNNGIGGLRLQAAAAAAPITFYNGSLPTEKIRIDETGMGLGITAPTAKLHIAAGTTTVAPMRLTEGVALTTPVNGSIEYHGSHLWFTMGTTRYQLDQQTGGGGGTGTVTSMSAGNLSPLFTTSVATGTTTPALSFALSNAAANTFFGNNTNASAAPSFTAAGALTVGSSDTNITLSVGGNAATSLLEAATVSVAWTGTLAATRGGTGTATVTTGDLLYGSATNVWSKLAAAATGNVLLSGSTPSWGKVALATHISGTLPVANGGTGLTALGSALQVLRVNAGGTALEYATPSSGSGGITNTAANTELMMSDGTNAVPSGLFKVSTANLLLGSASLGGTQRIMAAVSSVANADFALRGQGLGHVLINDHLPTDGGFLGVGVAVPDRKLHVEGKYATTNTVEYVGKFSRATNGSTSTGVGVGIELMCQTFGVLTEVAATMEAVSTDITLGSEDFDLVFKTETAGSLGERVRINGAGTSLIGNLTLGNTSLAGDRTISASSSTASSSITIAPQADGNVMLATTSTGVTYIGSTGAVGSRLLHVGSSSTSAGLQVHGKGASGSFLVFPRGSATDASYYLSMSAGLTSFSTAESASSVEAWSFINTSHNGKVSIWTSSTGLELQGGYNGAESGKNFTISGRAVSTASAGDLILAPGTAGSGGTKGDLILNSNPTGAGTRGYLVIQNLPTSSAGLPTGAIWNDSGTLKIA